MGDAQLHSKLHGSISKLHGCSGALFRRSMAPCRSSRGLQSVLSMIQWAPKLHFNAPWRSRFDLAPFRCSMRLQGSIPRVPEIDFDVPGSYMSPFRSSMGALWLHFEAPWRSRDSFHSRELNFEAPGSSRASFRSPRGVKGSISTLHGAPWFHFDVPGKLQGFILTLHVAQWPNFDAPGNHLFIFQLYL